MQFGSLLTFGCKTAILALPMSWSPDLSQYWLVLLSAFTALIGFGLHRAFRFDGYVGRLATRTVSVALISLGILLLIPAGVVAVLGLWTTSQSGVVRSPTGPYAALIYEMDAGATEPFRSSVRLKSKWIPWGHTIFFGDFAARELQVSWSDNSHLRIRFPEENYPWNRSVDCERSMIGIDITCEVRYPLATCPAPALTKKLADGMWCNEPLCFEAQLRKTDLQSFPMY